MEGSTESGARVDAGPARDFETFVSRHGEALRRALVASYGIELGSDACADALAWAWEHWARLATMANPTGYLYRVGQSATRKQRRWRRPVAMPREHDDGETDNGGDRDGRLDDALVALPARQRAVAILVHGYGYSYAEVAGMTGASVASVRSDLHRAMDRLRKRLEQR